MTTTDLSAVREAALDQALATRYDDGLRLLDATHTDDRQGRVLLALTGADVAVPPGCVAEVVLPQGAFEAGPGTHRF